MKTVQKSQLTCKHCSKIYKLPFELPCGHCLCQEHLKEMRVIKDDAIRCLQCHKYFNVKFNNEIKPSLKLQTMITNDVYLSSIEKQLKSSLKRNVRFLLELNDDYVYQNSCLEISIFEHLNDICNKIDFDRENMYANRIVISTEAYLSLIEKTKSFQNAYNRKLNADYHEIINKIIKYYKYEELIEIFRDPLLTIGQILDKRNELIDLKSELCNKKHESSNHIKYFQSINEYKKFEKDQLGVLDLNEVFTNPFESVILNYRQTFDLIRTCEFAFTDKWTLLYRGTRDGLNAQSFHQKCDGVPYPTLTIIKAKLSGYIFGGFTNMTWRTTCSVVNSNVEEIKNDSFLFSLTNFFQKSYKFCRKPNFKNSIKYRDFNGPSFSLDLILYDKPYVKGNFIGFSSLEYCYCVPEELRQIEGKENILAGSSEFEPSEIEVFLKNLA
jgi:hypothetical protein